ncbi:hypothetical protein COLO4_04349 [Corchorus olitorius]|uniref:Uncharacterized protein n=1 Tax=Corchorus olitorius TaxID=93759 RepID=A0A1R3KUF6_9ROSI|nr:hypothetical protein COLO4_04349 [Corchorus olitorius]
MVDQIELNQRNSPNPKLLTAACASTGNRLKGVAAVQTVVGVEIGVRISRDGSPRYPLYESGVDLVKFPLKRSRSAPNRTKNRALRTENPTVV